MIKTNRAYGIIAVGAYMSNFNADLSGYPKTTTNNDIFGSDKAAKFPMKRMWLLQGDPVLYIKSMKIGEGSEKMQPMDLNERYTYLFGALDEKTPSSEVLGKLFTAIDVMNFGATFAEKKQNISITGAVQINQGFNRFFQNTNVLTQDILSPFRNPNPKSEEKLASSIGTKIVTDETHYVYSFSVNPANYIDFLGLADGFEGYTVEAYEKFKWAARVATTAFNTNSKSSCENELTLFIELKKDSILYLSNLDRHVKVLKKDERVLYDLSKIAEILASHQDEIQSIELYINPFTVDVKLGALACIPQSIF